jgi:hypothetical protein
MCLVQDVRQTLFCLHPIRLLFDLQNKDTDLFVFTINQFFRRIFLSEHQFLFKAVSFGFLVVYVLVVAYVIPFALGLLANFVLEKNKKNIWKLQIPKWLLNSRWPPKFDLLLKSTNRLFYQIFFCLSGSFCNNLTAYMKTK